MPYSHSAVKVVTNGQTLAVTFYRSGDSDVVPVVYSEAAQTNALTLPYTITSDTTFYLEDASAGFWVVSVKQPDGTELWGQEELIGAGEKVIAPLPSAAQVGADVGASPRHAYKTGEYYFPVGQGMSGTIAITAGNMRIAPALVRSELSIAKIGISVTSAGSAGSVVRPVIYADNGSGYPGSLVLDAGAGIDGTSATVQEITLGSATVLSPGLYWVGAAVQVASCTVRALAYNASPDIPLSYGTTTPTTSITTGGYRQTGVTGSAPATFTTTTDSLGPGDMPRVFVQVS